MKSSLFSALLCVNFVSVACGRTESSHISAMAPAASPAASEDSSSADVLRFRDIFHTLASAQGHRDADIEKMLLLPDASLLTAPPAAVAATSASEAHTALVAAARQSSPLDLLRLSQNTPFGEAVDVDAIYRDQGPVTLVVIPGIFGEFIEEFPLHELFTQRSSFADRYASSLDEVFDEGFNLAQFKDTSFPLSERVHLGGTDGADGKPRVQAIFLQAAFGSMESLGANVDNARIFLRRLNKLFAQIPLAEHENIYLIGYSQGTGVALDMVALAAANPERYPFYRKLKGLITLSGVLYGTEVAEDAYFNPDSSTHKTLAMIEKTLDGLRLGQPGEGFIASSGKLLKNWQDILSLSQQLAHLPKPKPAEGMLAEHLASDMLNPLQAIDLLSNVFSNLFRLDLSPREQLRNLERSRLLIRKVQEGAKNLSTTARLAWWSKHQFPSHLSIHSLAASMPDVSTASWRSPLLSSSYYGSDTFDYQKVLRPGFYKMAELSGVQLNDSQVITHKSRIFPSLIQTYNPEQQIFPTRFMGIAGTHHWGLAFPAALHGMQGAVNPFPRRVLAEAMGAFVLAPTE